jgi:hypothetical protein
MEDVVYSATKGSTSLLGVTAKIRVDPSDKSLAIVLCCPHIDYEYHLFPLVGLSGYASAGFTAHPYCRCRGSHLNATIEDKNIIMDWGGHYGRLTLTCTSPVAIQPPVISPAVSRLVSAPFAKKSRLTGLPVAVRVGVTACDEATFDDDATLHTIGAMLADLCSNLRKPVVPVIEDWLIGSPEKSLYHISPSGGLLYNRNGVEEELPGNTSDDSSSSSSDEVEDYSSDNDTSIEPPAKSVKV